MSRDQSEHLRPQNAIAKRPAASATSMEHLDSAKASLLEGFAWLPSGSFPTPSDMVFSLAASHIRQAVEGDMTCSILQSLVNKEDSLLDAKTTKETASLAELRTLGGQVGLWLPTDRFGSISCVRTVEPKFGQATI
jgi:hypothetical protein